MEGMLQAVVVVFMLFLCSLCLFAVIVIVRDIIHENGKIRRARDRAEIRERLDTVELAELISKVGESKKQEAPEPAAPAAAPVAEETPKPEPIPVEEKAVVIEAPCIEGIIEPESVVELEAEVEENEEGIIRVGDDENAVVFSRRTVTLEEKYASLSSEFKRYFDEIIRHAKAKEGVREIKSANYYDYKNGSYKVLRINIKRGEIVCEFQFVDRDFLNYANASNVKMKQGSTSVKVGDASAVGAVKDGIDLVCSQIAEDREYKKNLSNQKRREMRKKEREVSGAAAPALVGVGEEEN